MSLSFSGLSLVINGRGITDAAATAINRRFPYSRISIRPFKNDNDNNVEKDDNY